MFNFLFSRLIISSLEVNLTFYISFDINNEIKTMIKASTLKTMKIKSVYPLSNTLH